LPKIQMEVISEPAKNTASILVLNEPCHLSADPFAVIKGAGDTDYVCGGCRVTLALQVSRGQLSDLVIKCLNCNSFNFVRGT
jgi:hypothetical protein